MAEYQTLLTVDCFPENSGITEEDIWLAECLLAEKLCLDTLVETTYIEEICIDARKSCLFLKHGQIQEIVSVELGCDDVTEQWTINCSKWAIESSCCNCPCGCCTEICTCTKLRVEYKAGWPPLDPEKPENNCIPDLIKKALIYNTAQECSDKCKGLKEYKVGEITMKFDTSKCEDKSESIWNAACRRFAPPRTAYGCVCPW